MKSKLIWTISALACSALLCHPDCEDCSGPLPFQCVACAANAVLTGFGGCVCAQDLCPRPDARHCSPACPSACVQCTGCEEGQCLVCAEPRATLRNGHCFSLQLAVNSQCKDCKVCVQGQCMDCGPNAVVSSEGCICQNGHFEQFSALRCVKDCGAGQTHDGKVCICLFGYPGHRTNGCLPCSEPCQTCIGPDLNDCLECIPPYRRENEKNKAGNCILESNLLLNSGHICDKTCAFCAFSQCVDCYSPFASISDGKCQCNRGFFPDPTVLHCSSCPSSCQSCLSALNCTSCQAFFALQSGVCRSLYPARRLQSCHQTCATCYNGLVSGCSTCASDASLISGFCLCNAKFFPNPHHGSCSPCDENCLTCSGAGANQCLGCGPSAMFVSGSCVCLPGTFPNPHALACVGCAGECATCQSADPASCETCPSNSALTGGIPSSCACLSRYGWKASVHSCLPCHFTCNTCDDSPDNHCTSCFPDAQLRAASPSNCDCSPGFFPDSDSSNCQPCHVTCATCVGGLNTDCQTCVSPQATLVLLVCTCGEGFFPDTDSSVCSPCHPTCRKCTGSAATNCSDCKAHAALTVGICVCVSGYFGTADACSCEATCLVCASAGISGCSSCYPNASLLSGTAPSSCVCGLGWFGSPDSTNCQPCHVTCKTCDGVSETNCLTCFDNAVISVANPNACVCDSMHLPDPDATNCATCHFTCVDCALPSIDACTICHPNAHVFEPPPGPCICDDGFFPLTDSTDCQPCHVTCSTCMQSGADQCLTCLDFAELQGPSPNFCICSKSAFPDPDVLHCSLCHPTCLTCKFATATSCLSCHESALLAGPAPSSCQCPNGSFPNPDASLCSQCDQMCVTCASNRNSCSSCGNDAELQSDFSCRCKEGFYGDPCSCQKCSNGCLMCTIVGCERCADQWFLHEKSCVATCPIGFITTNSQCVQGDMTPPEPFLLVNSDNSLAISFSKPVHMNLTASDFSIEVADIDSGTYVVTWSEPIFFSDTDLRLDLTIESAKLPDENQCLVTFLRPQNVVDLLGIAMIQSQLEGILIGFGNEPVAATLNTTVKEAVATVAKGSTGAVAATSVISGSPGAFWSLLNQLQLITYIPMTRIPIPETLLATLQGLNMGFMVPNPIHYLISTNDTTQNPPEYAESSIDSALFLHNTGLLLTVAVGIVSSLVPLYLLSKASTGFLSQYLQRLLPSFKWGIPLRWWIQSYLDIGLFSLLQVQQVLLTSGFSSPTVTVSFLLSVLAAGLFLLSPVLCYLFLWKYALYLRTRKDIGFNQRWGVLYTDFDPKRGRNSLLFYPFFLTRRLLFALSIILLYNYPKVQALLNISTSIAVSSTQTLLYVLIFQPYAGRIDHISALVGEGNISAVFLLSSAFFLPLNEEFSRGIETVAVWTIFGATAASGVLSAIRAVYTFADIFREYKLQVERRGRVRPEVRGLYEDFRRK